MTAELFFLGVVAGEAQLVFFVSFQFQRLVEMAMHGLINVIVYIDDILLHSITIHQEPEPEPFYF